MSILFANFVVAVLVVLQTATVTLLKRVSCTMADYPFTLTQLQPFSTTITFSVLYFIGRGYERRKRTRGYESILEESHTFPKWKLAIIGGLFTLSNFCLYSGSRGKFLSGPLLTLFQQVVVPCTIFFSIIILKRKFSVLHYLGALVIIGGIFFVVWPKLTNKEDEKNNECYGFYIIPSWGYRLHGEEFEQMPFLSSWAWINVFEFILTFPLVVAIPLVQGIRFHDIPNNVLRGYECFFTNENHLAQTSCSSVGAWFVLFIVVLVCNKLLMTYVIKEGSSALAMISLTCALPLSNIAFSSHHIVGKCSETGLCEYFDSTIDWRDFAGLGIVVAGLILYRYTMFVPLFTKKKELLNVNTTTSYD